MNKKFRVPQQEARGQLQLKTLLRFFKNCLTQKQIKYRDVAQLVARLLWEQDVAGSNPVIPTKIITAQKYLYRIGEDYEV